MIERLRVLHRAPLAGLAALVFLASASIMAVPVVAKSSSQNEALLELEAPAEAMRQISELPKQIQPLAAQRHADPIPPKILERIQKAVDEAYRSDAMLDAIEAALAATADAPAEPALANVAERFGATLSEIRKSPAQDPALIGKEFEARWQHRSDQKAISELVDLMASPEVYSEVMLSGLRIERLFNSPTSEQLAEIKAKSGEQIEVDVDRAIKETREAANDPSSVPFSREQALAAGKESLRGTLTLLPEADVAVLHAFYASPEGRAKRDALAKSFAARNDENARIMLKEFLRNLKP